MLTYLDKLKWGLAAIGGGLCLLIIMGLTVITVFGRYVMHADLVPGGYNMIGAAFFPLMVFWGLPLAHADGAFPRMEVIDNMLPPPLVRLVRVLILLAELAIYGILLYYCALFAMKAWDSGRQLQIGTRLWPAWPVVMMAPLAFALIAVEVARLVVLQLTGKGKA